MLSATPSSTTVFGSCVDSTLTISIRGRFDFASHRAFRQSYDQITEAEQIVVDLGQTEYVDSAALGMLLVLKENAGPRPIRIVACRPQVKRILEIAHFGQIFPISD